MPASRKTAKSQFPFRKTDGTIIWLSWAEMMEATVDEFTLKDGSTARRARDLEPKTVPADKGVERNDGLSDSLGFTGEVLLEMRDHLKESGVKGIEFREDPQVPGFYQVHYSSEGAKQKYMRARGFRDQNSRNGAGSVIGPGDIERAQQLVSRGKKPAGC